MHDILLISRTDILDYMFYDKFVLDTKSNTLTRHTSGPHMTSKPKKAQNLVLCYSYFSFLGFQPKTLAPPFAVTFSKRERVDEFEINSSQNRWSNFIVPYRRSISKQYNRKPFFIFWFQDLCLWSKNPNPNMLAAGYQAQREDEFEYDSSQNRWASFVVPYHDPVLRVGIIAHLFSFSLIWFMKRFFT